MDKRNWNVSVDWECPCVPCRHCHEVRWNRSRNTWESRVALANEFGSIVPLDQEFIDTHPDWLPDSVTAPPVTALTTRDGETEWETAKEIESNYDNNYTPWAFERRAPVQL